jgi:hypothetical protein
MLSFDLDWTVSVYTSNDQASNKECAFPSARQNSDIGHHVDSADSKDWEVKLKSKYMKTKVKCQISENDKLKLDCPNKLLIAGNFVDYQAYIGIELVISQTRS